MRPALDAGVSQDLVMEPAPARGNEGGRRGPYALALEEVGQLALDSLSRPWFGRRRTMPGPRREWPRLATVLAADARQSRCRAGAADGDPILDRPTPRGHEHAIDDLGDDNATRSVIHPDPAALKLGDRRQSVHRVGVVDLPRFRGVRLLLLSS